MSEREAFVASGSANTAISDDEDLAPLTIDEATPSPMQSRRDTSGGIVAAARSHGRIGSEGSTAATPRDLRRLPFGARGNAGSGMAIGDLTAQLQRVWQRQRFRSDERALARDIEKIVSQLRQSRSSLAASTDEAMNQASGAGYSSDSGSDSSAMGASGFGRFATTRDQQQQADSSSDSGTETGNLPYRASFSQRSAADANVEMLLEAMDALFRHRYQEVRTLAFEVTNLCLTNYGDQLTTSTRQRVFQQLEVHDQSSDSEQLQKTLRLLTFEGRRVEPFRAELGWLLLQWLEESDEQRDLLHLIQQVLKRSPLSLDFETVIAITSVVCGRCDVAWSRGDVETCKRFLSFFHVLATHRLEHALGTSVCLRTLCWMVNADGQATWSVMKHLLNSSAGFQILRGLVMLLESPSQYNQWILRGAVFFVGMSCWGSQRVAKLDEIKWAPILMGLETCLQCENGVVVFEIILAIQRLVKKYGDSKPAGAKDADGTVEGSKSSPLKRLVVEWDIILRMLRTLRPWLDAATQKTQDRQIADAATGMGDKIVAMTTPKTPTAPQIHTEIPIHMTRLPKELLDTLQVVVDLVCEGKFGGEIEAFYDLLIEYFAYLPESALRLLLRFKAEEAHPAHNVEWLHTLHHTMTSFFVNREVPASVRNEALELLQVNLWSSRNVCEDRVVEEVLLPMLAGVYNDPEKSVRRKGLDLITEVARTLESVRFDALLDILENAVQLSSHEDSQLCAIAGIVSLFSSYFNHLPQTRAIRMYDIITSVVESHRNWEVRECALKCLLHVCESSSDFRLQWRDNQVRTSRFLFCSRSAVRNQQTGAFVPIHHGLRALLTLISKESHSGLFRMAVEGLRKMLHNRVVLTDIDISDTAMKIISCVDYQAFGRAAIADEMKLFLKELQDETSSFGTSQVASADGFGHSSTGENRYRSARNYMPTRIDLAAVKSNIREAAALLCKIRFTTMGLQLLELFVSYMSELTPSTRHHLTVCVVGTLDTPLQLSEHDLDAPLEEDHDTSSTHSGSAWIWPSRPRSSSTNRTIAGNVIGEDHRSQAPAQASGCGATSYAESKPVSPHVPFTSRVLSKLQSTAHQSSIFTALSASSYGASDGERRAAVDTTAFAAAAARHERELLHRCLRLVYDAEFFLLHTATNAVSVLGLIAPEVIAWRLDMLLQSSKNCFYTPDGLIRHDGYSAVLEMISNLIVINPAVVSRLEHKSRIIDEFVLVSFRQHIDKATTYLAYRILCEIIFQCEDKEQRVVLAATSLPKLKDSAATAITSHTMSLAEAAIDLLMCFALTRSDIVVAPALRVSIPDEKTQDIEGERVGRTRRSWIHHNAIVSIEMRANQPALLVVRRPSSTSRWHLSMRNDYVQAVDGSTQVLLEPSTSASPSRAPKIHLEPVGGAIQNRDNRVNRGQSRTLPPPKPPLPGSSGALPGSSEHAFRILTKTASASTHITSDRPPPHHLPVPPLPAYDGIGGSPSFFCEASPAQVEGDPDAMQHLLLNEGDDVNRIVSSLEESSDVSTPAFEEVPSPMVLRDQGGSDPYIDLSSETHTALKSPSMIDQGGEPNGTSMEPQQASSDHSSKKPAAVPTTALIDPVFLMMQLFDLSVEDRPQLLTDGPSLTLGLNVLDRTPEFETHKVGVLYMRSSKQKAEVEILRNFGGSLRYLKFLRSLGTVTPLEGLQGYAGGMDTSSSKGDGTSMLLHRSHSLQMVFHVATMMNSLQDLEEQESPTDSALGSQTSSAKTMKKKRHIGNDFVHIIFKECDAEYDIQTFSGQFNDVHIIVQPLNDQEYRTQVKCKPGIAPFGPLFGTQVIPSAVVAQCVRQTALNANLACHAFHQELIGFTMNCEERLKQIKQLGSRYATQADEWTL